MTLRIKPVETKAALKEFIGLPPLLYRSLPGYVAPLRLERSSLLDPSRGSFFRRGRAQYWIARRGNDAVGRISAQIDPVLPRGVSAGSGMIGCLDACDDADAIAALLAAAETWLAEQGCTNAFGPCTLSMNEEPGLMIAGQHESPMILTPWHPAYLQPHLEATGYQRAQDLHTWRIDKRDVDFASLREKVGKNARKLDITLRSLDKRNMTREIELMCRLYNDAWQHNWGFAPLAAADLAGIERDLKHFLPDYAGIFVELQGRPVAVLLVLPNMFDLTGDLGADPSPLGWLKLGLRSITKRFRSGRVILMGVSSELRHSIGGAAIAMTLIDELILRLAEREGAFIEAGWVLESNSALNRILERLGFRRVKTFRLYSKPLLA